MRPLPFCSRLLVFISVVLFLTLHLSLTEAKLAARRPPSSSLSYSVPTSVGVVQVESLPDVRYARKGRHHHSSRLGLYGQPSVASESYTDPDTTVIYAEETPELAARANRQIRKSASRIADNVAANSVKAPEITRLSTRRAHRSGGPPVSYYDVNDSDNDDALTERSAYVNNLPVAPRLHRRRRPVAVRSSRRRAALQNSAKAYKRSHNRGHDTLTKATGDLDTYGQRLEYGYAELEGYGLKDFSATNNGIGEDENLSGRIADTQLNPRSSMAENNGDDENGSSSDAGGRYTDDFDNGVKGLNFNPKFF